MAAQQQAPQIVEPDTYSNMARLCSAEKTSNKWLNTPYYIKNGGTKVLTEFGKRAYPYSMWTDFLKQASDAFTQKYVELGGLSSVNEQAKRFLMFKTWNALKPQAEQWTKEERKNAWDLCFPVDLETRYLYYKPPLYDHNLRHDSQAIRRRIRVYFRLMKELDDAKNKWDEKDQGDYQVTDPEPTKVEVYDLYNFKARFSVFMACSPQGDWSTLVHRREEPDIVYCFQPHQTLAIKSKTEKDWIDINEIKVSPQQNLFLYHLKLYSTNKVYQQFELLKRDKGNSSAQAALSQIVHHDEKAMIVNSFQPSTRTFTIRGKQYKLQNELPPSWFKQVQVRLICTEPEHYMSFYSADYALLFVKYMLLDTTFDDMRFHVYYTEFENLRGYEFRRCAGNVPYASSELKNCVTQTIEPYMSHRQKQNRFLLSRLACFDSTNAIKSIVNDVRIDPIRGFSPFMWYRLYDKAPETFKTDFVQKFGNVPANYSNVTRQNMIAMYNMYQQKFAAKGDSGYPIWTEQTPDYCWPAILPGFPDSRNWKFLSLEKFRFYKPPLTLSNPEEWLDGTHLERRVQSYMTILGIPLEPYQSQFVKVNIFRVSADKKQIPLLLRDTRNGRVTFHIININQQHWTLLVADGRKSFYYIDPYQYEQKQRISDLTPHVEFVGIDATDDTFLANLKDYIDKLDDMSLKAEWIKQEDPHLQDIETAIEEIDDSGTTQGTHGPIYKPSENWEDIDLDEYTFLANTEKYQHNSYQCGDYVLLGIKLMLIHKCNFDAVLREMASIKESDLKKWRQSEFRNLTSEQLSELCGGPASRLGLDMVDVGDDRKAVRRTPHQTRTRTKEAQIGTVRENQLNATFASQFATPGVQNQRRQVPQWTPIRQAQVQVDDLTQVQFPCVQITNAFGNSPSVIYQNVADIDLEACYRHICQASFGQVNPPWPPKEVFLTNVDINSRRVVSVCPVLQWKREAIPIHPDTKTETNTDAKTTEALVARTNIQPMYCDYFINIAKLNIYDIQSSITNSWDTLKRDYHIEEHRPLSDNEISTICNWMYISEKEKLTNYKECMMYAARWINMMLSNEHGGGFFIELSGFIDKLTGFEQLLEVPRPDPDSRVLDPEKGYIEFYLPLPKESKTLNADKMTDILRSHPNEWIVRLSPTHPYCLECIRYTVQATDEQQANYEAQKQFFEALTFEKNFTPASEYFAYVEFRRFSILSWQDQNAFALQSMHSPNMPLPAARQEATTPTKYRWIADFHQEFYKAKDKSWYKIVTAFERLYKATSDEKNLPNNPTALAYLLSWRLTAVDDPDRISPNPNIIHHQYHNQEQNVIQYRFYQNAMANSMYLTMIMEENLQPHNKSEFWISRIGLWNTMLAGYKSYLKGQEPCTQNGVLYPAIDKNGFRYYSLDAHWMRKDIEDWGVPMSEYAGTIKAIFETDGKNGHMNYWYCPARPMIDKHNFYHVVRWCYDVFPDQVIQEWKIKVVQWMLQDPAAWCFITSQTAADICEQITASQTTSQSPCILRFDTARPGTLCLSNFVPNPVAEDEDDNAFFVQPLPFEILLEWINHHDRGNVKVTDFARTVRKAVYSRLDMILVQNNASWEIRWRDCHSVGDPSSDMPSIEQYLRLIGLDGETSIVRDTLEFHRNINLTGTVSLLCAGEEVVMFPDFQEPACWANQLDTVRRFSQPMLDRVYQQVESDRTFRESLPDPSFPKIASHVWNLLGLFFSKGQILADRSSCGHIYWPHFGKHADRNKTWLMHWMGPEAVRFLYHQSKNILSHRNSQESIPPTIEDDRWKRLEVSLYNINLHPQTVRSRSIFRLWWRCQILGWLSDPGCHWFLYKEDAQRLAISNPGHVVVALSTEKAGELVMYSSGKEQGMKTISLDECSDQFSIYHQQSIPFPIFIRLLAYQMFDTPLLQTIAPMVYQRLALDGLLRSGEIPSKWNESADKMERKALAEFGQILTKLKNMTHIQTIANKALMGYMQWFMSQHANDIKIQGIQDERKKKKRLEMKRQFKEFVNARMDFFRRKHRQDRIVIINVPASNGFLKAFTSTVKSSVEKGYLGSIGGWLKSSFSWASGKVSKIVAGTTVAAAAIWITNKVGSWLGLDFLHLSEYIPTFQTFMNIFAGIGVGYSLFYAGMLIGFTWFLSSIYEHWQDEPDNKNYVISAPEDERQGTSLWETTLGKWNQDQFREHVHNFLLHLHYVVPPRNSSSESKEQSIEEQNPLIRPSTFRKSAVYDPFIMERGKIFDFPITDEFGKRKLAKSGLEWTYLLEANAYNDLDYVAAFQAQRLIAGKGRYVPPLGSQEEAAISQLSGNSIMYSIGPAELALQDAKTRERAATDVKFQMQVKDAAAFQPLKEDNMFRVKEGIIVPNHYLNGADLYTIQQANFEQNACTDQSVLYQNAAFQVDKNGLKAKCGKIGWMGDGLNQKFKMNWDRTEFPHVQLLLNMLQEVLAHWSQSSENLLRIWRWIGIGCMSSQVLYEMKIIFSRIVETSRTMPAAEKGRLMTEISLMRPLDQTEETVSEALASTNSSIDRSDKQTPHACVRRILFLYEIMTSVIVFPFISARIVNGQYMTADDLVTSNAKEVPDRAYLFLDDTKSGYVRLVAYVNYRPIFASEAVENIFDGSQWAPAVLMLWAFERSGCVPVLNTVYWATMTRRVMGAGYATQDQVSSWVDLQRQEEARVLMSPSDFSKYMSFLTKSPKSPTDIKIIESYRDTIGLAKMRNLNKTQRILFERLSAIMLQGWDGRKRQYLVTSNMKKDLNQLKQESARSSSVHQAMERAVYRTVCWDPTKTPYLRELYRQAHPEKTEADLENITRSQMCQELTHSIDTFIVPIYLHSLDDVPVELLNPYSLLDLYTPNPLKRRQVEHYLKKKYGVTLNEMMRWNPDNEETMKLEQAKAKERKRDMDAQPQAYQSKQKEQKRALLKSIDCSAQSQQSSCESFITNSVALFGDDRLKCQWKSSLANRNVTQSDSKDGSTDRTDQNEYDDVGSCHNNAEMTMPAFMLQLCNLLCESQIPLSSEEAAMIKQWHDWLLLYQKELYGSTDPELERRKGTVGSKVDEIFQQTPILMTFLFHDSQSNRFNGIYDRIQREPMNDFFKHQEIQNILTRHFKTNGKFWFGQTYNPGLLKQLFLGFRQYPQFLPGLTILICWHVAMCFRVFDYNVVQNLVGWNALL